MNIKIRGLNTNYIQEGEGEDIVLLHGWGVDISYFDNMILNLKKSHKVTALDLAGFGKSDQPNTPWSAEDYGDFVLEFIEKLNIKKTSLLGHSNGGRIIINLASRKNLNFEINKIVLTASAGIVDKKSFKQKISTRIYKIGRSLLSTKIGEKLMPGALDKYRAKRGSADYNNASPIMRQTLVLLVNKDLRDLLPKIKQPTLLIWGDQDTATPLSHGKIMEQLIPDAGLVILKGGSHFAYLEQGNLVDQVLNSFFNVKEI